jgi:hypothetical protein
MKRIPPASTPVAAQSSEANAKAVSESQERSPSTIAPTKAATGTSQAPWRGRTASAALEARLAFLAERFDALPEVMGRAKKAVGQPFELEADR